jgi:hypothetical protein
MINSEDQLFSVWWDNPKTAESIVKLHKAMHDSEFRICRDPSAIMMARCLGNWTMWFISLSQRQGERVYSKICILQRALRRWFMRRRLCVDRVFSKAAAAYRLLNGRLNEDVLKMVVSYCMVISPRSPHPRSPLRWIKPERDGRIFEMPLL